ncbi:MAG: hypothetical protein K2M17_00855 [Bacilli bacterium]|nr:hypothetical protein [Bacilli bacterium]
MIKYVTRNERRIAIARATKIVRAIQEFLAPDYKINPRLVGSARYNAVICDDSGVYDMDYQLVLTHNCKCEKFDADTIRKDFFNAFNSVKNKNEKVENSTSVITVRVSNGNSKFNSDDEIFSFDFAIVIENGEGSFITRRNDDNHYVWNKLPSKNSYIYETYFSLDYSDQKKIIDRVISRKIKEKTKPKDNRITSSVIFMEEVNKFGD